jgi:transcriptional regulator GlxA family with amidase domain
MPLVSRAAAALHGLMPTPSTQILLFDGVDELDAVGPYEVLAAAGFATRTVVPAGQARQVTGGNGLALTADAELGERPGLLVVPGGGWLDARPTGVRALVSAGEVARLLAGWHTAGTVLASVCTGALLLAAAGVLDGRPAVTNRLALDDLAAAGADVRPDARVVDAGDVVTCGGPLAGIDLAIRLVERWMGPDAGRRAAERVEHERVGPLVVAGGASREDVAIG